MTEWFVLVESNTTGTGRLFCAVARGLGLRPVLLTRDPDRYPYVAEDGIEYRVVETTDVPAVLAASDELGGVVAGATSSSEYSIATAAEVARRHGRPHPDPEAIRACRDKHTQRTLLRDGGVPSARFAAAATPEDAVSAATGLGLPVVVKPVAGSGSIGTRLCADLAEVHAAAAHVLLTDPAELALPPQRAVVVEEYLAGDEFSVETMDTTVVGVTRKHLGPEPFFVEIGHDFPAPLAAADTRAIGEAAVAALHALGLGWGAAHVELRWSPELGPRVVEVNPRLAGGMIPRLVDEAIGVDLIAAAVARAAGRPVDLTPARAGAASIRFLVAADDGVLREVTGVEAARAVPGVVDVTLTRDPGHQVRLRNSFQDRIGHVIAAARAGSVAARAADDGLRAIEARIEPASAVAEGSLA
ncbi:MAG TPA: ATP-grasp domain-containing protein [Pseudonocardiaceae bacterium]